MPCKRSISKEEGLSLSCWGLTFLPPYSSAPLFHLEGSVGAFPKELFPLPDDQEPSYEESLYWLQFAFTDDSKGQYVVPVIIYLFLHVACGGGASVSPGA